MPLGPAPLGADIGRILKDRSGQPYAINTSAAYRTWFAKVAVEVNRIGALVDISGIGDFTSLKIGGVEVISAGRTATFESLAVSTEFGVDGSGNLAPLGLEISPALTLVERRSLPVPESPTL